MNNIKDIITRELESYSNSPSIFIDEAILTFDFLPKALPHRDNQILELTRYFRNFFRHQDKNIFFKQSIILLGPLGTGKTSTAKRFGSDLERISELKIKYFHMIYRHFNCRTHRSVNILLVNLLKSLLPYYPKRGFSTSELILDLFNTLEGNNLYLVLTLDEIDYLFHDDKINNLLYSFIRTINDSNESFKGRLTIILITKNSEFLFLLDPSIKTSLAKNIIHFPSYTSDELKTILEDRIKISLRDGAVIDQILSRICEIAAEKGGDARLAIEILWRCAKIAESFRKLVVQPSHLRSAFTSINAVNKLILGDLTKFELLTFYSSAKTCQRNSFQYKIELSLVKSQYLLECENFEISIDENNLNIWPYLKKLYKYGFVNIYINGIIYNNISDKDYMSDSKITEISIDLPIENLIFELKAHLSKISDFK